MKRQESSNQRKDADMQVPIEGLLPLPDSKQDLNMQIMDELNKEKAERVAKIDINEFNEYRQELEDVKKDLKVLKAGASINKEYLIDVIQRLGLVLESVGDADAASKELLEGEKNFDAQIAQYKMQNRYQSIVEWQGIRLREMSNALRRFHDFTRNFRGDTADLIINIKKAMDNSR